MKNFENFNKSEIIYLCSIIDDNVESENYAFFDIKSRDNFIINYINNYFEDNEDIENIFDAEELIEYFNEDNDNRIILDVAEILENVKLDDNIKIRKDTKDYNL